MEEKINIVEILKDKSIRTKLYSPLYGEVFLSRLVGNNGIRVVCKGLDGSLGTDEKSFWKNGKYTLGGEICLFPSKEMRDWAKFSWKKGDALIMDGCRVVFDKWLDDTYARFNAVHLITSSGGYFDKPWQNRYTPISNFITKYWRKMTDLETKIYMESLERECGGKLNLTTLNIEKTA